MTLNGFHEWYQNELLTQTPGAGRKNYTYNAPGSVHRGGGDGCDWRPVDGWRLLASYSYNNQIFTSFIEQRGPSSFFDRAGYKIPNVAPHELTTRLAYDHPYGEFKGLGAFVEYVYKHSYFIDNGNQLTIPSYGLVNLNAHYERELKNGWLKGFSAYVEVRNLFDRTYVAGAAVVSQFADRRVPEPGVVLAQNAPRCTPERPAQYRAASSSGSDARAGRPAIGGPAGPHASRVARRRLVVRLLHRRPPSAQRPDWRRPENDVCSARDSRGRDGDTDAKSCRKDHSPHRRRRRRGLQVAGAGAAAARARRAGAHRHDRGGEGIRHAAQLRQPCE